MAGKELLRVAREVAGISQRALAAKSGVAQPRIAEIEADAHDTTVSRLEQLLAPLGVRLALLPGNSRPICDAAVDISEALANEHQDLAWRHFLQLSNDLVAAPADVRVALCVMEPAPTGDQRYDALLAGLAEYRLSQDGLPIPGWVQEDERVLGTPWDVEQSKRLRDRARASTPRAFSNHGVYLAESELSSI